MSHRERYIRWALYKNYLRNNLIKLCEKKKIEKTDGNERLVILLVVNIAQTAQTAD